MMEWKKLIEKKFIELYHDKEEYNKFFNTLIKVLNQKIDKLEDEIGELVQIKEYLESLQVHAITLFTKYVKLKKEAEDVAKLTWKDKFFLEKIQEIDEGKR